MTPTIPAAEHFHAQRPGYENNARNDKQRSGPWGKCEKKSHIDSDEYQQTHPVRDDPGKSTE
jgi:hypothetical protein